MVKKEKVLGSPFEPIVRANATDINAKGVELKSFTITNMPGLLSGCEKHVKSMKMQDISLRIKLANQLDVLGYAELTTYKEEDRRKLLVTELVPLKSKDQKDPWAYAVFTKSVGTGKTARLTLRANVFAQKPFKKSDIIYAQSLAKERSGYWYLYDYHLIL